MIDAFWTRWRVRRLCKADQALAGKWLDDYAGWLYWRAWYCTGQNEAEAHRILSDTLSIAAGRIADYLGQSVPMSEWLLGLYLTTEGAKKTDFSYLQDSAVQTVVRSIPVQPIQDSAVIREKLLQACQCALALLNRDDQEILISRYLRMETPAQMAVHHAIDSVEMQRFLYRARHAFRRTLESLTGTVNTEMSRPAQDNMDVLEANLENLFQSFEAAPRINSEEMNAIRATVLQILSEHKPSSPFLIFSRTGCIVAVIAVLVVIVGIVWQPGDDGGAPNPEPGSGAVEKNTSSANKNTTTPADMGQEVKLAFELGEKKDMEGLIRILQTGSYPAQLVAANYLGRFADKTAIDALDQAAQKWYAHESNETNPFIEAIKAIENRAKVRLRLEEELEKLKAQQQEAAELAAQQEPISGSEEAEPAPAEPNKPETTPNTTGTTSEITGTPTPIFQQPEPVLPEEIVPTEDVPATEPNLVAPQEEDVPDPNDKQNVAEPNEVHESGMFVF